MPRAWVVFAGLVVLIGMGVGLYWRTPPTSPGKSNEAVRAAPKPTLYCDFYNFMHAGTVVSFYFAVEPGAPGGPRYTELYVVENEGERTDFGAPGEAPSPQWSYGIEDGTPVIASPDGDTQIVLYGLKPKSGGVLWVEAGVRSNTYRNLEGKCRQAYFGSSVPTNART